VLLSDNFAQDKVLNGTLWTTATPLLNNLGQKSSAAWVAPQIAFSSAGMAMSGASGTYEFTGIQSTQSFTPPFTTEVTVMGTVANGNPFVFYLSTGDLSQSLSVSGNLNPSNGSYYGINLNTTDTSIPSVKLYPSPAVNVWYTISVAVDATGQADVIFAGASGTTLASQNGINLGTGPFYLALAQLEGLPYPASIGPNTAIWQQIQVSAAAAPAPTINAGGAVSAASYATGAPLAPGSIAAVYGNFLLSAPSQALDLPLPTSLSGLSVQFGSEEAPLFYASNGQVNLQVPWELAGAATSPLSATLDGQTGPAQTVQLASFSPGIFAINAQGAGQGAITDAFYQLIDGSNPAVPGSTIIEIFCTGLGPVTNQPPTGSPAPTSHLAETKTTPTVTVGTVPAKVLFSGLAPGFVGLYQVNALLPETAPGGNAVPVVISIGGMTSNTVTIAVQGPTGTGTPSIVHAVITDFATTIQLPPANMYLYGMVTGGAFPSSTFAVGQYAQAVDADGYVSAALAYGTNSQDSYTTSAAYYVLGGVAVSGSWDTFNAFYGSNSTAGASNASVNFTVSENSLVVFLGLASSQQSISLGGIPGLQVDAVESGSSAYEGMVIAHASLKPGTYTVTEQSAALAAGQDPANMADLISVFVFGSN
jgi:uncharacterized protein (TIGR03437 family)